MTTDPSPGSDPRRPDAGSTPPEGWGPPPGYATPPPGWGATGPQQGYGQPPPGWGQSPYGQPGHPAHHGGPSSSEDTTWAVLGHLSIFVIPLLGPLVAYLVKKDTSPFVRQHAAEALNFHITLTIAVIVSSVLMLVLIGFVLLFAAFIAGAVLAIIATVAAGKGEPYRYPLTFHFVS